MPDRIAPNPPSPFADADPQYRHIIPVLIFIPDPTPGALVVAGCERMAVVPDEPMRNAGTAGVLPDGLCPACLAAMRREELPPDTRPITDCRTCDGRTEHDGVCALCRQEMHEQWIAAGRPDDATLEQTVAGILEADAVSEHDDNLEGISHAGAGEPAAGGRTNGAQ